MKLILKALIVVLVLACFIAVFLANIYEYKSIDVNGRPWFFRINKISHKVDFWDTSKVRWEAYYLREK